MKAEELRIGNKVGYLNLRTGKYKYVPVVGIGEDGLKMCEKLRAGWHSFVDNNYTESIENLNKYANTPSVDFTDGRALIKLR